MPTPDATAPGPAEPPPRAGQAERRWISVVFLQGTDAKDVFALIDRDGVDAAVDFLIEWDVGDATTRRALENGYVYDSPPEAALDRTVTRDGYALTYNRAATRVSLLRAFSTPPDSGLEHPRRSPCGGVTRGADPARPAAALPIAPVRRTGTSRRGMAL